MNEELNNYVKGNKRINIFNMIKVCKLVENMAIDEIRKIGFSEPMYKIYCCIRDFRGYDIETMGDQLFRNKKIIVNLNKKLIDAIGDKATLKDVENLDDINRNFTRIDLFLILFHELEHVRQSKMFETGNVNNTDLYKDRLLRLYFEHFGEDYYAVNYKVTSEEVLANIKAVQKTIDYFNNNGIDFNKYELEILKRKMDSLHALLNNKERINPIDGKVYNLDYLYEMALNDERYRVESLTEGKSRK